MNPFRNRPWLFIGLIFYTIVLTAALLYFRFPAEQFRLYCETSLEALLPGTDCSIKSLRFKFPLSFEIEQITILEQQNNKEQLCVIDLAAVRPKLSKPTSHFHVDVTAFGGEHEFNVLFNREAEQFKMENIQLADLDLIHLSFLSKTFRRDITGILSGKGSYQGTWQNNTYKAEGKGNISIKDGNFSLLFPILSLKKIDLKQSQAEITLQGSKLQFNKGSFQGRELGGNFSGHIAFETPVRFSKLLFKGELSPMPPLLKKSRYAKNMVNQMKGRHNRTTLPFLLQGNLLGPRFKFDS